MIGKYKYLVDLSYLIVNIGIIISCILTFNDFMTGLFEKNIN